LAFDYALDYKKLDLRKKFKLYKVGKGEQGVLLVRPYKDEILPYWRFRTPETAVKSARKILNLYLRYKKNQDFIGMDMARKFLQMGYTRSRRYANHASGKKYEGPIPIDKRGQSGAHGRKILAPDKNDQKAASAAIFLEYWKRVESDPTYIDLRIGWKILFG
jgi:hypothetical protein